MLGRFDAFVCAYITQAGYGRRVVQSILSHSVTPYLQLGPCDAGGRSSFVEFITTLLPALSRRSQALRSGLRSRRYAKQPGALSVEQRGDAQRAVEVATNPDAAEVEELLSMLLALRDVKEVLVGCERGKGGQRDQRWTWLWSNPPHAHSQHSMVTSALFFLPNNPFGG